MEKEQSTCMASVGPRRSEKNTENLPEEERRTITKESLRLKEQSFLLPPVPAHDAKIRKRSRVCFGLNC
jgi:hypothetical protein